MKCSYHPSDEARELCTMCNKSLCAVCSHQIKGKVYCEECLVRGAEWAASMRNLKIPADSPKRAALCSLIPGMGAVYNNEYMKALTYFAVFAALVIMGDRIDGVFGFGAFAFLVFTIFDSYRTAETNALARLEAKKPVEEPDRDRTVVAWGIFLIVLGVVFLLQNIIPYYFLNKLWPVVFIALGGYLIFYAIRKRDERSKGSAGMSGGSGDYLYPGKERGEL